MRWRHTFSAPAGPQGGITCQGRLGLRGEGLCSRRNRRGSLASAPFASLGIRRSTTPVSGSGPTLFQEHLPAEHVNKTSGQALGPVGAPVQVRIAGTIWRNVNHVNNNQEQVLRGPYVIMTGIQRQYARRKICQGKVEVSARARQGRIQGPPFPHLRHSALQRDLVPSRPPEGKP